jgi:hypothetical protein
LENWSLFDILDINIMQKAEVVPTRDHTILNNYIWLNSEIEKE